MREPELWRQGRPPSALQLGWGALEQGRSDFVSKLNAAKVVTVGGAMLTTFAGLDSDFGKAAKKLPGTGAIESST